ncbi:hypothetical protein [Paenibacillus harenae]|uniref:hypothetical protein n=1 Tax=Paenibacillus harenae TaxID=306543 RepID=UPI00048F60A4|nr:hypothetical protein [Paenibacillus harenae]
MESKFVITFEEDKEYRRFLVSHVMTRIHREMAVVDLVEEVIPNAKKFLFNDDNSFTRMEGESSLINHVHATISIQPDQLPFIIESLQKLYNDYKTENNGR